MIYNIIPTVDCVFKAILGSVENKNLLINFLNAVLVPEDRIVDVKILNPYNEKEFIGDKLTVIDIKATDDKDRTFQVEVQTSNHPGLVNRMLHNWSSVYKRQLKEGNKFDQLQPVISIWVLIEDLFKKTAEHLSFGIYDLKHRIQMSDHFSIHILQLNQWSESQAKNDEERWLFFFKYGKDLDDENLPEFLKTKEMEQAMSTLRTFSEKEKAYDLYQNRLNAIRIEQTWLSNIEEAKAKVEKERAEKEKLKKLLEAKAEEAEAKAEKAEANAEKERAEKERLKKLLEESGIRY